RILGRFSAVLAGFVLGVALGLVRLGAGRVALGVLRRFVGGARHGAARGIGSGRLGGRLILLLIRLLLALLLTGVSAALPLLLLFLLLLFQGLRVDRRRTCGGEHGAEPKLGAALHQIDGLLAGITG